MTGFVSLQDQDIRFIPHKLIRYFNKGRKKEAKKSTFLQALVLKIDLIFYLIKLLIVSSYFFWSNPTGGRLWSYTSRKYCVVIVLCTK